MSEEERPKQVYNNSVGLPHTRPRPLQEATIPWVASMGRDYDISRVDYLFFHLTGLQLPRSTNQPGAKMTPPGLLPFYMEACKEPQRDQVELTSRPKHLFEVSLSALNNYCGTVCRKLRVNHKHQLPYLYRGAYQDDFPFIMKVYKIEVRVLDYIFSVVRLEGTTRENMADLAQSFISQLTALEETLRLEHLDERKVWRVKVEDMLDFLVEPSNRSIFRWGKEEISILHNSLSMCAIHQCPTPEPRR